MTDEKILEVLDLYQRNLEKIYVYEGERLHKRPEDCLHHCLDMIPQMRQFLKEGRREKVFRWLGFIQGVLWCEGVYTIEQMKDHNKPPGGEKVSTKKENCPFCLGDGYLFYSHHIGLSGAEVNVCKNCNGSGKVNVLKSEDAERTPSGGQPVADLSRDSDGFEG